MNSSNFNKFIEDFSSIDSSDTNSFERVLKKYPYFQTAALFLAKSNPIQQNTQTAALRSADRRVLRSWLDEKYRKELEKEKQELEARKEALEIENNQKNDLDINTESINAFDKLVGTPTIASKKEEPSENIIEESNEEKEIIKTKESNQDNYDKETTPANSFFDEIEEDSPTAQTESVNSKVDSSSFFDNLEDNEELEKTENSIGNSDANFFDEVEQNETDEPIFKEQSDINEPLITDAGAEIPPTTTDANFFDEVEQNEVDEPIFKEQSDISEPLITDTEIPPTTTDANFFDEIEQNEVDEPIFKEQSDISEPLITDTEIPPTTTDANFFDEIESDDEIFGDAQKDLDAYDFPDFEDEKDEAEKNKKEDDAGSFFDDI
ncbi:hypothetical protein WAF17_06020 [Bernardetia sp. ABR2-2B]|uniref:hypothetical protein n=1 Tax=Bernardetia sp. ABR2-2B TaxID=3127472 RepID=UPI0030CCA51E